MKKQIFITLLFLILLAGIVYCASPAIIHYGLQIFPDGIRIGTDPNNAFLSNGNITAKTIYSNGNITATLDANSLLPVVNTPDLHTNLDANSIGLGVAKDLAVPLKVFPNQDIPIEIGRGKMGYVHSSLADYFVIGHYDNFNATDYSFYSGPSGSCGLNCRFVSAIYFQSGGSTIMSMNNNGLAMSAGKTITSCNIEPVANDTYYIGKDSTTSDQKAYKGVILRDTTNTKYYRLEITNGAVVATEIYAP